jgi:DNA-binding MarR family transcriptional regulator
MEMQREEFMTDLRKGISAPDSEVQLSVDDGRLRSLAGYSLKRAYLCVHDAFAASVAEFELRNTSFSCLALIVANPDIVPSRLAEALRMERPNLVVIVDALEERELISRRQLKSDRRYYALRATLKGRRLFERALANAAAAEAKVLQGLSADEVKTLFSLLGKIERPSG